MNKHNAPYKNFSSFVLRTPIFPFDYYKKIFGNKHTSTETLKQELTHPVVKEAIFLASPDLYAEMEKWLHGELVKEKEVEKLVYSLVKYLTRMSTRCTPFGLFSGCTLVNAHEGSNVELAPLHTYKKHTRLDMNYLCALAQDLSKLPEVKENIKFYPNTSIYKSGAQLRYVEYRYINARRNHFVVGVDHSEYLQKIVEIASSGALFSELVNSLVDDEITIEDAQGFVNELINSQFLVNELEPAITGPEFLDQIIHVLEKIKDARTINHLLNLVKVELGNIDRETPGIDVSRYYTVAKQLDSLNTKYESRFLFQTDLIKPANSNFLGSDVIHDVLKGIGILNRLTPPPGKTNLSLFKEAFQERYEEREVSLLEVLEVESGIGYLQNNNNSGDVSPLIDDIVLPSVKGNQEISWDKNESFLHKKYTNAIVNGDYNVTITDEDVKDFELKWQDLPETITSMVQIVESNGTGNTIFLHSTGGTRASNLLGRFCHTDGSIHKNVLELIQKEEEAAPEAIYAEIIHLPESRTGNILLRPVLRNYEIPYLAKSYVPEENQIKLDDLTISVRGGRIVLFSKKLNKEIRPCLTTAHNYSYNALPIYHFLCDLQAQNIRAGLSFHWGAISGGYSFLPRVTYKNMILSLAQWKVTKEDVASFMKITDDNELVEKIQSWRENKKIPSMVALADGDNELVIHLDNILCIKMLLATIKNRASFQLTEFIAPPNSFIKSEEGSFANEIILTFYKEKN